jgi:hypothetical protein
VRLELDLDTIDGYRTFLKVKSLPVYRFTGRDAWFPDEYADRLGIDARSNTATAYAPRPGLFDYQRDIAGIATRKRKFAVFADCGLGKTFIFLEVARHWLDEIPAGRCGLIVSPSMVVNQTIGETAKFYGDSLPVERVTARDLPGWLTEGRGRLGITNYEAITERITDPGRLAFLILDESSLLKSHYGKWGSRLIHLGRGLDRKLCLTGTPAPNDRIEYANHAVFLDQFPTVNSFLSRFFVNRGETANRWELKPHALRPFYRALSHWCVFLSDPSVYGWKDNAKPLPPINTHIIDVELTAKQKQMADQIGGAFGAKAKGGIASRAMWARLAKGIGPDGKRIDSHKPGVVCDLARGGTSIVWCKYNPEQADLAKRMPEAANVSGETPDAVRLERIGAFQRGEASPLLSKPKILGFGLNLQVARRQVFSTVQDSYEEYWQAVKRSNRTGSTGPLDVFAPVTELERPMLETVLRKMGRVAADTREQESIFREVMNGIA